MADPNVILEVGGRQPRESDMAEEQADSQKAIFRVTRALLQMAKSKSASYRQSYQRDWLFLLGENHWPVPSNAVAARASKFQNRGVRNWLFATCSQKAEIVLGAKPHRTAIPYGGPVDFIDKWKAQEAMEELLRQMRAPQYDEDCLWDGMANGKGYTRVIVKADPRSGMKRTEFETCDGSKVYVDPSASRLSEADYLHYEPWMTMAQIRKAFPLTWQKVKADRVPIGETGKRSSTIREGRSRTDSELLSGGGYEFSENAKGELDSLGSDVCFTWVRNEEVLEDVETRIIKGEQEAFHCAGCGDVFSRPLTEMPEADGAYDDPGMPSPIVCPMCGSEAIASVTVPAETEDVPISRGYKYPFGRLIVTCKDGILWGDPERGEGLNPDKIDDIFPIFEYHHYRVPGRFNAYGEVAHLRTAQLNANKNMQQLMDYLRTSVNGVLEYPARATQYQNLSNAPNPKIGLPPPLIGLARFLPPAPFNLQAFVTAEETIRRDFQEMSGITDVVYGLAPSAPTSGKEVMARRSAASTRTDGHIRRFNEYRGARDTAVWQLNWQHGRDPRYFPVRNSEGEMDMTLVTIRELPRNLKFHISSDPDDAQRGELVGQVLQGLMTQPGPNGVPILPMWPDLLMPTMGLSTFESESIQDRLRLQRYEEEQMLQAQRAEMAQGLAPPMPAAPGMAVQP